MDWEKFLNTAPPLTAAVLGGLYFLYQFAKYWTDKITIPKMEKKSVTDAALLEVELEAKRAETKIKLDQSRAMGETMGILNREFPRQTEFLKTVQDVVVQGKEESKEVKNLLAQQALTLKTVADIQKDQLKIQQDQNSVLHKLVVVFPQLKENGHDPPRLGGASGG